MKCSQKLGKKDVMFLLAGLAAGAVNGFLGGGGGTVLVPMLKDVCGLEPKKALATSVASIAPICAVSAAIYFTRGSVSFGVVWPYALGGLAGGALGGMALKKLRADIIVKVFGALMVASGVRILWIS